MYTSAQPACIPAVYQGQCGNVLEQQQWQPVIVWVPVDPTNISMAQSSAYESASHPLQHALRNFDQVAPAVAEQSSFVPLSSAASLPMGPNFCNLSIDTRLSTTEIEHASQSPPVSCLCTPEVTPRYYAPDTWRADNEDPKAFSNVPIVQLEEALPDRDQSDSGVSECSAQDCDMYRCWDYIPRDPKSYASSEASTAISFTRSARRRRGRRSAKAKAKASAAISEAPVLGELLVTEEQKKEVMQRLELGGEKMQEAIADLCGSMLRLSLEPYGCRVVQRALEVASVAEKEDLVNELRGCVRLCIASPNANFVIQKIIEVLPSSSTYFVAEEVSGVVGEVARHRFGCRVMCRLVEHHLCGNSCAADILIDELLVEADQLLHHNFARHILELVLEHGCEAHKRRVVRALRSNLLHFAKNRCASYVLEKALEKCEPEDSYALAHDLLVDPETFLLLAVHECGMHVVKAIVKSQTECAQSAKKLLLSEADRVKSTKFGLRLFEEM